MSFFSTPRHLWRRAFIGQDDEEGGQWVTIRGVHIFIREGETLDHAINYLKIREFENNYMKSAEEFGNKKLQMTPEEKQKFLDEKINKPLKEGYLTAPQFFRGCSNVEVFDYLRTGKFQSMTEQQLPDGYTSLTLSPKEAYLFGYGKGGVVTAFESSAVRGSSKPSTYLVDDYPDNFEKIKDGAWNKDQPSPFIDEAEIKGRNLSPFPNAITVYASDPEDFYSLMIYRYKEQFGKEPPASFMGRLNNIKIRSLSEFKKIYGMSFPSTP